MKAILCFGPGKPDELDFHDIPEPIAGTGEAVVKIAAAALNFFDTLIIAGRYQTKPTPPFSPAAEFAGVVERVGYGVTQVKVGDRVMGYCGYGAAREQIAVPATSLVKIPENLDFDRAAGLSVTYGTTYHALKDRAQLKKGESLVILGAAGGTGLAAIELGKLMGAHVIACASSEAKTAFARRYGADEVVNYGKEELRDALKALTGDRGADVIYDPIGGPYAEAALRAITWGGRFLVIGFASGEITRLPLNLVLLKGCDVRGVFWGSWTQREPQAVHACLSALVQMCADGKLSAHVHAVYPLEKTAQAIKDIAARRVMGKAILRP